MIHGMTDLQAVGLGVLCILVILMLVLLYWKTGNVK